MNAFDTASLLYPLLYPLLGAALGWTACHLWLSRKLRRCERRIAKLHADRETLQEQVRRARSQVGQLQQDLTTLRTVMSTPLHSRTGAIPVQPSRAAEVKARLEIPSGLVFEPPQLAAHGFADTQTFLSEETV